MAENDKEFNKDEFNKIKDSHKSALDRLFEKVKKLIYKMKEVSDKNNLLKENIKELNNSITELKLQSTKINSDSVVKDKEISDLKNMLLDSSKNVDILQDKENIKSRIKELISRIDVHLEEDGNNDDDA
ncbi:hypothetical protein ACFLSV_02940 [Bacteroidota bacterium]